MVLGISRWLLPDYHKGVVYVSFIPGLGDFKVQPRQAFYRRELMSQ